MSQKSRASSLRTYLQLLCVATLTLMIWGCGDSSYDQPISADNAPIAGVGAASSVLIDPATLKGWIDQGLVNDDSSFNEKVVVLDFFSAGGTDRIAGASRVAGGELNSKRVEGLAVAYPMVATGGQMDDVIQRLGIDEGTTVVFTTGNKQFYSTRAYWMFRYWGFPMEKLKLLNGGNAAFEAAYPGLMTTAVVEPAASTYSVKDVGDGLNDDLRLSLGEMLGVVASFNADDDVILDARGLANYGGTKSSPGYVTGMVDLTVYDGHPEGGQFLTWTDVLNADGTYKSKADLEILFSAKGWSKDKTTTVYCLSGYSATPLYFAVEAILGAKAQLYDGSWSQFGQYSDNALASGELPAGSAWATDQYLDFAGGYRYNFEYVAPSTGSMTVETLAIDAVEIAAQPSPFDGAGNPVQSQVEADDAAYVGSTATVTFANKLVDPVLVSATDLQGWMNFDHDGLPATDPINLVNAELGGQRVVILDVTDAFSYAKSHLPGAQLWNISEHVQKRVEGPAPAVNMVLDGSKMDAMIQKHGIDENTTIIITSSKKDTYFPSRAYFLLRYYGFPKTHVKVLDGYNGAWAASDLTDDLTALQPTITASSLSVADIADIQLDTRVSLAELMAAVRDGSGTPVDFRGNKSAAGSTPGVFSDVAGDYVAFEGTLKGGEFFSWKSFNTDYAGGDLTFNSAADITTALTAAGITTSTDGSNPVYSYCRTGYIASTGFFVLDGILGVDVMAYDGSWSQWGKMSTVDTVGNVLSGVDKVLGNSDDVNVLSGGQLPAGSAWATDSATYMSTIKYNVAGRQQAIESLDPEAELLDLLPGDAEANQVESADAAFKAPVAGAPVAGPPTPFTPAGGGC